MHALPRHAAPQFSVVHRRTTHFAYRYVDANDGAALAGLQADGFRGAARGFRFCEPGADAVSVLDWWVRRRPLRPTARRDCHANRFVDSCFYSFVAKAD